MALGIFTSPLRGSVNILPLFTSISKNNCEIYFSLPCMLSIKYKANKGIVVVVVVVVVVVENARKLVENGR